ncbi:MAG: nitrogenase cofactor biosynthesis protein NifB [Syntrophomonas sp.]
MKCTCTSKQDIEHINARVSEKTRQHPCFSVEAHHRFGRIHLPVAPACNIGCNYCNRKFDCSNESRPGVASQILSPQKAFRLYMDIRERHNNLKVAGIAGPGDALANWEATVKTLRLIKNAVKDAIFCLSTNGLRLPEFANELLELGVEHITVTVNCLDPVVGARIYRYVNYQGERYQGAEAAGLLIENQLQGIEQLARCGAAVKVNTVMIPSVNDRQIPDVVRAVRDRGAFVSNIMPLIPAPGSIFENLPRTGERELKKMRQSCVAELQQMFHCRQCRADAVGLLGRDIPLENEEDMRGSSIKGERRAV